MADGALLTSYLSRFGVRTEEISGETVAFAAALDAVARVEPAVADAVLRELAMSARHLKLIASENFASSCGVAGDGQLAERQVRGGQSRSPALRGLRQRRHHRARVDELACALFGADHAYAQPHSGIDANLVAFWAVLSQRVESPALERLTACGTSTTSLPRTGRRCVRSSGARRCSACRSRQAGTSLTASGRTSLASSSATALTGSIPRPFSSTTTRSDAGPTRSDR